MSWIWRMEDGDGATLLGVVSPWHLTQSDAESWLGEQWRELLESGVIQLTLLEDDRVEYGPMPLSAG